MTSFQKRRLGAFRTRSLAGARPFLRDQGTPASATMSAPKAATSDSPTLAGPCYFGPEATTPGTPFYKFRRIIGEHALRYMAEHDPSTLRFADPLQVRIDTVSHELSDLDRTRAANTDQYIRSTAGKVWSILHFLRAQDARQPDVWKATVALIENILEPFCAVCEGSGMSHRTIRKHPHEEWRKWQAAGLRFIADREFNTEPFTSEGVVTDPRVEGRSSGLHERARLGVGGLPGR